MTGTGRHRRDERGGLKSEIARKAIHLSSLSIAIIYCHITRELALVLLTPLFAGFFIVDFLKNHIPAVSAWYHRTFDAMLREHELGRETAHFNGATFITFSALMLVLLFPKMIAIAAFSLVAVSDTLAALVGKKFGRHKIGEKSLEGSAAFLLSAIVIVFVVPRISPAAGIVMALCATLVEAMSLRIGAFKVDDNLTIPLAAALSGYLYYLLFLPSLLPGLSACP